MAAACYPQALPASNAIQTYFDNNGIILSNGYIGTYQAGSTSLATTYTDATESVANQNPVPLNASGQAQIWLQPGLLYKLVVMNSFMTVLYTVDDLPGAGNNGGSASNLWKAVGANIVNTNGGYIGLGCTSPLAEANICGGSSGTNFILRLDDNSNSPGLNLYSSGSKTASWSADSVAALRVGNQAGAIQLLLGQFGTMTIPPVGLFCWSMGGDATGTPDSCLARNAANTLEIDNGTLGTYANLVLNNLNVTGTCTGCGGGGGGGSPGGPANSVQINNGTGGFGGSANLTYVSQLLTSVASSSSVASIAAMTGFIQSDAGFLGTVGSCLEYNCFQAPAGGMEALSFSAVNYIGTGFSSGVPTATAGDSTFPNKGNMYCDTGSTPCVEKLYNGSAWVTLATGGATSPGGSTNYMQFNSAGSFAGVASNQWCATVAGACTATGYQLITVASPGAPGLSVGGGGYIQADNGFLVNVTTSYNSINAVGNGGGCSTSTPCAGIAGRSGTFTTYTQLGSYSGSIPTGPTVTTSDSFHAGAVAYSLGSSCLALYNGSAWGCIGGGGGGPVTGIVGTANQVLANGTSGSTQTGTVTLTLPQSLATTSNVTFGNVTGGLFNSSLGSGATLEFQAGGGNAQIFGNGNMNGALINAASGFQVSGSNVINSGQAFVGTGGIVTAGGGVFGGSLNIAGSLTTVGNINAGSGTFLTSTGLDVTGTSTSNSIQTSGGVFATVGFAANNTASNSIQTIGGVNACSVSGCVGASAVSVAGSTVINSSSQWIGKEILANGNIQTTGVYAVSGGFFGSTANIVIGSCTLNFQGGILYGHSGC